MPSREETSPSSLHPASAIGNETMLSSGAMRQGGKFYCQAESVEKPKRLAKKDLRIRIIRIASVSADSPAQ